MHAKYFISVALLSGSLAATIAPAALAASPEPQAATSANWSGYVAESKAGKAFSSVSGSWVEPSANCSAGEGHASFWVGLGGAGGQASHSLEQAGTAADCNTAGGADHYAWYELLPAPPVRLRLAISPGDHVTSKVSVDGTTVKFFLADTTTGQSASKTLHMDNPDVSSAEWIAEAPSSCDGTGNCAPLPLANFGTARFSHASATSDGHTGTISDPQWTTQPVALNANSAGYSVPGLISDQSSGNAQPSNLSGDGSAFSVSYVGGSGSPAAVTGGSVPSGSSVPSGGSDPSAGSVPSAGSDPSAGASPGAVTLACVPTSEGWACGYVLS